MALTFRVVKRIDLPHEPDQWIEARMPSLAILDRAREARSRKAIAMMAGIDLSQIKGLASTEQTEAQPDYDWATLLSACILTWSYPDVVTAENVAELDEETVGVMMAVLVPKKGEADRKNGSGGSMMPSKVMEPHPRSG